LVILLMARLPKPCHGTAPSSEEAARNLAARDCINLRLPTYGGL